MFLTIAMNMLQPFLCLEEHPGMLQKDGAIAVTALQTQFLHYIITLITM